MLLVLRDCDTFGFWPGEYGGGGEGIDAVAISITSCHAWYVSKNNLDTQEDAYFAEEKKRESIQSATYNTKLGQSRK